MKIFLSGLYCSGKTTLAKKIAKDNDIEYISFDNNFNYQNKNFTAQAKQIFNMLGDKHFIMDAIPFNDGPYSFNEFNEYYEEHRDVSVFFVFCPEFNIWMKRLEARNERIPNHEACKKDYYYNNRPFVEKIKDKIVMFFNSYENKYIDFAEFKKLTSWLDEDEFKKTL